MRCPLCDRKIPAIPGYDGHGPSFQCTSEVIPDPPGTMSVSHYTKDCMYDSSYEEEAIVLPFKIINYFTNTDYRKPRSEIHKYQLKDVQYIGKRWTWVKIMDLPYILEILKYKRMQNRLKNILLFS
jgi:hypothetical protein